MRKIKANLPIKLEGTKNTRDLGGYQTTESCNTASGQFLRSDNPGKLSEKDVKLLYNYGVRLIIDFRSESETQADPNPLKGYKDVAFINPQLIDNIHTHGDKKAEAKATLPPTLGEMYIDFMENKKHIYQYIFKEILKHEADCVFFNCTAGKDRAGTMAMLLLKLAGVDDEVIIADYAISGDLIKEDMDRMLEGLKARGIQIDEDMLRSNPKHMTLALKHIKDKYGDISNWYREVGLSDEEIEKLKNKVLGNY